MALVPTGQRRLMVAQILPSSIYNLTDFGLTDKEAQAMDPGSPNGTAPSPVGPGPEINDMGVPDNVDAPDMQGDPGMENATEMDSPEMPEPSGGDGNLGTVVFKFLEGIGYPPRRLHEFKNQFFDERGSKTGDTQVTITLPDEVYGSNQPIPKPKLKQLVDAVEKRFGLSFVDYQRSNLKVILNFSSTDPAAAEMQEGPGDVLDQVYGKPQNASKNQSKAASTINEMIKGSKNDLVATLKKIMGGKA